MICSSDSGVLRGIVCAVWVCLFLSIVLLSGPAFCAAPRASAPVEITDMRISWVGPESSISPKEKGQRSFWKGGTPTSSTAHGIRNRRLEGASVGNWGKMDVEFTTNVEWADEIEFRFYLLLKDKGEFKMLTGKTTVIYVAAGKGHYVVMYAYSNAIARHGGDVQGLGVQAVYNGKVVSEKSIPKNLKGRWWEELTPIGGAVVDWFYTPMKRQGLEAYEFVKTVK